ncbi:MAG: hypothetical protein AAB337_02755, partial [Patescibacteria group bacterium]
KTWGWCVGGTRADYQAMIEGRMFGELRRADAGLKAELDSSNGIVARHTVELARLEIERINLTDEFMAIRGDVDLLKQAKDSFESRFEAKANRSELDLLGAKMETDLGVVRADVAGLWSAFREDSRPIGGPSVGYGSAKGVGGLTLNVGGGIDGKLFGAGGSVFGGLWDQGSVAVGLTGEVYGRPTRWLRTGVVIGWQQLMVGIREPDGQSEWEYSGALIGAKASVDMMPKRNGGLLFELLLADYANIGFKGATKSEVPAYAQGLEHDFRVQVGAGWRFGGYNL